MSRLEKRVAQLEGGKSDVVWVWARVPEGWPRERQEAAAEAMAREQGVSPPFAFDLVPEHHRSTVELLFIGDLGRLLRQAAEHGKRLGQVVD